MEIAILRHGKSSYLQENSKNRITSLDFREWVQQYNNSSLLESSRPSDDVLDYARQCKAIISSSLQRSIDSAKILNKENFIIPDALFVEAGLPSTKWSFIKLYPDIWALFFRILWLFGYSNNSESYKEAKARANLAATKLNTLAEEHQRILFAGHGIFNRLLVKELRGMGWVGSKTPSSKYWSVAIYTK